MPNKSSRSRVREQVYAGSSSTWRAFARSALQYLWPGLFFIISFATVAALTLQRP
jgi:hypothetical protein